MFSALALDHINTRRNIGPMEGSTHYGVSGVPGEGPYVELWFRVADSSIEECRYKTNGCPTSIASASVVASLLAGKSVQVALSVNEHDIAVLLGEIPEGKEDCPQRVVDAIQAALAK